MEEDDDVVAVYHNIAWEREPGKTRKILWYSEKETARLQTSLNVDQIVKLLSLRGIKDFEEARLFFRPELKHLHDPFLMKGMKDAAERLQKAASSNEHVLIYGDYDVDGTTAVSLVYSFLRALLKSGLLHPRPVPRRLWNFVSGNWLCGRKTTIHWLLRWIAALRPLTR